MFPSSGDSFKTVLYVQCINYSHFPLKNARVAFVNVSNLERLIYQGIHAHFIMKINPIDIYRHDSILLNCEWVKAKAKCHHHPPRLLQHLHLPRHHRWAFHCSPWKVKRATGTFWRATFHFVICIIVIIIITTPTILSLIHIWRCRRYSLCRSRWSPYH